MSTGAVRNVLTKEEIQHLAVEGGQSAETLMNVVALIAKRFRTDVCSAYLLEPDRANLVLAATVGLRRACIGNLRMAVNEGLTGLVAEQVQAVAVSQVKNHPRFKYFRDSGEDAYQSFLGVPLIDRGILQGVLVVQTIEARTFGTDEIRMLAEAAFQVAPIVSEARTLDRFIAPLQERLWLETRMIGNGSFASRRAPTLNHILKRPVVLRSANAARKLWARALEHMRQELESRARTTRDGSV